MNIPARITAGDSVSWREEAFSLQSGAVDVRPPAWSLSLSLRGPLAAGVDVVSTVDAGGWLLGLTAPQTAALNNGPKALTWYWQLVAINAPQRLTVASGQLKVKPNLSALTTSTTFDGRSQAEQILSAIEAEIKARLDGGATLEYSIGERSLKRESLEALMSLRKQYRQVVRLERRRGKSSDIQSIQVRFT